MSQQITIARLENSIALQERTLGNLTSGPVKHMQAIYTCQELIAAFKADLAAVRLGFRNSAARVEHFRVKMMEQGLYEQLRQ